ELNIKTILLDDKDGIKKALQNGLKPIKSVEFLVTAKTFGLIDSVKEILETMTKNGNYVSPDEYLETLKAAGELLDHDPSPLEDMQSTTSDTPLPSPSSPSNQHEDEDQEEEIKTEESGVL
ncbi:MAG: DUF3368 domain-containing protein, partial [Nitrospirae bacterium]|nr:DUF3368 domain-containing protein [Nitrospirota bacterium]